MSTLANDPILSRFRADLGDVYGAQIDRVILFGSRARGEARADSDYDILVFLWHLRDFAQEAKRIASIETAILDDTGAIINALPLPSAAYGERTGFMMEVRRDGLDL